MTISMAAMATMTVAAHSAMRLRRGSSDSIHAMVSP
jgi:hypothetical protein